MGKIVRAFTGAPKQQQVAPIPAQEVKVIPKQDEAATSDAKRKATAQMQQRGGVAATVLSDTLGG